jgi:hypothetical protein
MTEQEMNELLSLMAEETMEYRANDYCDIIDMEFIEAMEDSMNTLGGWSYSE